MYIFPLRIIEKNFPATQKIVENWGDLTIIDVRRIIKIAQLFLVVNNEKFMK